jgi:hypothetical protein
LDISPLATNLPVDGSVRADEPFAGQRELLEQRLATPAGKALPPASALVAGRLGNGEPELLLMGTPTHGGAPLTRDARFAARALEELLCYTTRWSAWQPEVNQLVMGELSHAAAIGLDWLSDYAGFDAATRAARGF